MLPGGHHDRRTLNRTVVRVLAACAAVASGLLAAVAGYGAIGVVTINGGMVVVGVVLGVVALCAAALAVAFVGWVLGRLPPVADLPRPHARSGRVHHRSVALMFGAIGAFALALELAALLDGGRANAWRVVLGVLWFALAATFLRFRARLEA